jgi:hypothetical protein
MLKPGKILVVSQYYPPDSSTTAVYVAAIAEGLARDNRVVVLSGSPNSDPRAGVDRTRPEIVEIANRTAQKDALVKRAVAISLLATGRCRVLRHHAIHAALCGSAGGKAARRGHRPADL